jgi:hypothetical protein
MGVFAERRNQSKQAASSSPARSDTSSLQLRHRDDPLVHRPGIMGNQVEQAMVQTPIDESNTGLSNAMPPRFGNNFSRISVHTPATSVVQTKLAISKPGGQDEQEAVSVANEIMRMPEPQLQRHPLLGGGSLYSRIKQPASEPQGLQTKLAETGDLELSVVPPIVQNVLGLPGQAIDPATRAFMEPRFGHDFSHVRVHTDAKAAQSAQAINAHAYTVGANIVFNDGHYAPGTSQGRSLLAHELTHVIQQSGFSATAGLPGTNRDHSGEAEATAASTAVAQSAGVRLLPVAHRFAAPCVARQAISHEFPGFSQNALVECGAASLVSALLIWDRERNDPNSPNTLLVTACNTILIYMLQNQVELLKKFDTIPIGGTIRQGRKMYIDMFTYMTSLRDTAKLPRAVITEAQYKTMGLCLYHLHVSAEGKGMSMFDIQNMQDSLGIKAGPPEVGKSFDELMNKLSGLQPGQNAQVSWYSRGKMQADGSFYFTPHAFLVGRFQRGPWFVSDQGDQPPTEIDAPDFLSLKAAIVTNTQKRNGGIHTGVVPTRSQSGIEAVQTSNPDIGVIILGNKSGIEKKAQEVIMKPGDFIAEVDHFWDGRDSNRITAVGFVARAYTLLDAINEMNGAGIYTGGVIVERPRGVFHVFKTTIVSEFNVMETKIDESNSKNGNVTSSSKHYDHAWLQLRSRTKTGSFFQVY